MPVNGARWRWLAPWRRRRPTQRRRRCSSTPHRKQKPRDCRSARRCAWARCSITPRLYDAVRHGEPIAATAASDIPSQIPGANAMDQQTYWVYILAGKRNGTLYIGVTNDLLRRVWQHREGILPGFTKKYGLKHL